MDGFEDAVTSVKNCHLFFLYRRVEARSERVEERKRKTNELLHMDRKLGTI